MKGAKKLAGKYLIAYGKCFGITCCVVAVMGAVSTGVILSPGLVALTLIGAVGEEMFKAAGKRLLRSAL